MGHRVLPHETFPTRQNRGFLARDVGPPHDTRAGRRAGWRRRAAGPTDRPILSRCVECHAGEEPAGGLDLTTRSAAIRGGESGAAIRPMDAPGSLVYRKVAAGKM